MYGYKCEYCQGTVQPRTVKREAFKHKNGFIILEDITIGVCDLCGNRYYSADILHTVHDIAAGIKLPERTEAVPVSHLAQKKGSLVIRVVRILLIHKKIVRLVGAL